MFVFSFNIVLYFFPDVKLFRKFQEIILPGWFWHKKNGRTVSAMHFPFFRKILSIPKEETIVSVIAVGKADENPSRPKRKELNDILKFDRLKL